MNVGTLETLADPTSVCLSPCAKLNLTLEVFGRREDGYHEVRSVVVGVGLRDDLEVAWCPAGGIRVSCDEQSIAEECNLVTQAARRLAALAGRPLHARIGLRKHIPLGGGLGGGSSDAAATLRALDCVWSLGMERHELEAVAAEIGSDVPLFFSLPAAMVAGRGERVEPVTLQWSGWALLVLAGPAVSTSAVYQAWRPDDRSDGRREDATAIVATERAADLESMLFNDLTRTVLKVCPTVGRVGERLEALGAGHFHLTGAGSTWFRLLDHEEEARELEARIKQRGLDLRTTVAPAPVAQGPMNIKRGLHGNH